MSCRTPQELSAAFAAAIGAGDVPGALELWLDDATIVQPDGNAVRGRAAIGAALTALLENDVSVDVDVERTFSAGAVAVAVGTLTLSGERADGTPYRQSSRSVVIYERGDDGQWRLAIDAPWGLPQG